MSRIISMHALDYKKERQNMLVSPDAQILSVCVRQEVVKVAVEHDVNAYIRRETKEWKKVEFAVIGEKRCFNVDEYNFLGTVVLNFGNDIYHVLYRYV